jgi:hypothetical protein
MSEKEIRTRILSTRIQHKHDTEANWKIADEKSAFTPLAGELIIYDKDDTYDYKRFKFGDGSTTVDNLPFCLDSIYSKDGSFTIFGCTNQICTSTDTSGQVYNGIGYKNGIRWSSSGGGEVAADNMGMTGFITVKPNDVLRLKNVSIVTNSYVVYFNANKQVITTDSNFGSPDPDGVYTKTLANSDAAFIRLALGRIGKATVATINEEIGASGEYNIGWLIDNSGKQFAPYTLSSSIFDENGESYSSAINNKFAQVKSSTDLLSGEIASKAAASDLTNHIDNHAPSNAEKNVQSDWSVTDTSSDAYIKNKPSLATVATSGSYNDLTNKPTIPVAVTVDTTLSSTSTNPVQNKVVKTALDDKANKSEGTFYIEGSGTTDATNKISTWVGTSDRITSYYDGLAIRYKIGIDGQTTTTLNINNLGEKTVYRFGTSKLTTHFPVGSIIHLIYHEDLNEGCWMCSDYDSNTNTQQRVYPSTDNVEYPITARYNTTTGSKYYAEYGRYSTGVTLNPSTNTITATTFNGALTGNADTATKATKDVDGNNIVTTYAKTAELGALAKKDTVAKADLDSGIQASLNRADTALQSDDETDPTVPDHVKKITANDITNWNNKSDFDGNYNSLSNRPTIPTVNNGTLTIKKNGTAVQTFTANQSSNIEADITVPTGAAADKDVDTSISVASTSTNLPTSKAVAEFVEGKGYKTTDYTFATGDNNGQIKVTSSSGTAQNISVKGLGSAAFATRGAANGVAELDADGKVPSSQLPSSINVTEADHAAKADSATNADHATNAEQLGGILASEYARKTDVPVTQFITLWEGSANVQENTQYAISAVTPFSTTAYDLYEVTIAYAGYDLGKSTVLCTKLQTASGTAKNQISGHLSWCYTEYYRWFDLHLHIREDGYAHIRCTCADSSSSSNVSLGTNTFTISKIVGIKYPAGPISEILTAEGTRF